MDHKHDLIIIGGGVGGLVTASVAGQLGLDVVLVERGSALGGDCLHHGCVPSKTLLHSASVAQTVRNAEGSGISAGLGDIDLEAVMDRVRSVIARIQQADDPDRFRGYGVDVQFGEARFLDARTIEVKGNRLRARRFVIATGSQPTIPPIPGLDDVPYLTNETVFDETTLPARLAVIGGGPIGTELGQAFARLGSRVTLIEAGGQILPKDDPALAQQLRACLESEGVSVRVNTRVESAAATANDTAALTLSGDAGEETLTVDRVLVAAGRKPNLQSINPGAAGLELAPDGTLTVDARLRTRQHHIYACGDCAGPYPFTHMAEYQASVIISNAIFRMPKKADYSAVPWVTYTDPELAHVGMTVTDAQDAGIAFSIAAFPVADVDRAIAQGQTAGELRLIVSRGKIIGASLLSPHAGELIHEIALAIAEGIPLRKLAGMIHAYPTLAQITKRAAGAHFAPQLFSSRTRGFVKWINRILP
ncbi:dihydrolipoyl dehydrogenase family protein [Spiribacter vilamensis]|uniref:Pyruvate/2-oxoglutarate dehydrogenase complex dihydrolipoamide dehydrogenase (E3) component n=1 Tax=Spiribacter vilamensis TaxID=531306 RepID=A0A4Q8CZI1_9GAMM|nr:FAD-dependent oxidoreductase [Spiribacter vilamensis]RZU98382.1 pyruvate/2-oxoglutarate dehydrogenase complex dihydrolipoamide dehydrogenase (E3) component [Spiribacter vilamensis]TVO60736.1 pyridine nucleotide-disulfide oxidoreductase [Spiribacter vilamensis]